MQSIDQNAGFFSINKKKRAIDCKCKGTVKMRLDMYLYMEIPLEVRFVCPEADSCYYYKVMT